MKPKPRLKPFGPWVAVHNLKGCRVRRYENIAKPKPSKTKPSKSTIPDARGSKCRNKPSNLSSCMLSASISGHKDPNPLGAAQFPVSIFLDNSHQIHKVTSLTCQLLLSQVRTVDLSMLDRRYGPWHWSPHTFHFAFGIRHQKHWKVTHSHTIFL